MCPQENDYRRDYSPGYKETTVDQVDCDDRLLYPSPVKEIIPDNGRETSHLLSEDKSVALQSRTEDQLQQDDEADEYMKAKQVSIPLQLDSSSEPGMPKFDHDESRENLLDDGHGDEGAASSEHSDGSTAPSYASSEVNSYAQAVAPVDSGTFVDDVLSMASEVSHSSDEDTYAPAQFAIPVMTELEDSPSDNGDVSEYTGDVSEYTDAQLVSEDSYALAYSPSVNTDPVSLENSGSSSTHNSYCYAAFSVV